MKKYGLVSAIALIVLTNIVVLAGVAFNRSGEPDATLRLSERELHWQKRWGWSNKEDTGVYLKLKWNMPGFHYKIWTRQKGDSWFNKQKLEELGFDTGFPLNDKKAYRFYNRQLPRQGYVVLEFDGDAYKTWLEGANQQIEILKKDLAVEKKSQKKKDLEKDVLRIQQEIISKSHLFAIDAGLDAQVLRNLYLDKTKYIITPAIIDISLHYSGSHRKKPFLSGMIKNLSIPEIHVTSDYRSFFITDIKTHTRVYLPLDKPLSDLDPRYEVTLNYGKRHEPWVAGVQKLK